MSSTEKESSAIMERNSPTKRQKKIHFSVEMKRMIFNDYRCKMKANPTYAVRHIVDYVAKKRGVSGGSVYNVIREHRQTHTFKPPQRRKNENGNRTRIRKRIKCLDLVDDIARNAIREKAHQLLLRNEMPTIEKVLKEVNDDEDLPNFKRTTFYKLLKSMNLKFRGRGKNIMLLDNDEGTSASAQTSAENEFHDASHSQTDEDSYQYDGDGDGDSDAEDTKVDILEIADTQILPIKVEPVEVEEGPEDPAKTTEHELFGEYIAKHLQQLPLDVALKLQSGIQALVMETRLEYIRQHPSEAPDMFSQEAPAEEEQDEPATTPNTETPNTETPNPAQNRPKRPQNTDPPRAKRFKPDNSDSTTTTPRAQHKENKRTDCIVFAEHIALQLERLPEVVYLRLQSDIYAMITQAYPQSTEEDSLNRVKIKDEPLEEIINT